MNPREFASHLIDICAKTKIVKDYDLAIHENIVVRSKITLTKGFLEVYKNFDTDKTAFAWIVNGKRIFGADNTGGWHIHPYENPSNHKSSESIELEDFLEDIEEIISKKRK